MNKEKLEKLLTEIKKHKAEFSEKYDGQFPLADYWLETLLEAILAPQ